MGGGCRSLERERGRRGLRLSALLRVGWRGGGEREGDRFVEIEETESELECEDTDGDRWRLREAALDFMMSAADAL